MYEKDITKGSETEEKTLGKPIEEEKPTKLPKLKRKNSTDRIGASAAAVQYLFCIIAAVWLGPRSWANIGQWGREEIWTCICLGGTLAGWQVVQSKYKGKSSSTGWSMAI